MIRQYEIQENDRLVHVRALDGVHDMVEVAERRIRDGRDDLGNASLSGDSHFTGTPSLDTAVALAKNGWPEGVDKIQTIASKLDIDPVLLRSALKVRSFFDVAGDEPDIDRYLEGDPESMVSYSPEQTTHGRVIDLIVNVGQHASVDKLSIENRGAAILSAVEALRSCGYSVGVFAVEQCTPSGNYRGYGNQLEPVIRYEIPILEAGQAVNVDTLAFSLMHPSFLRRLQFAMNERESHQIRQEFGFNSSGGYGIPVSLKEYKPTNPSYKIDKDDGLHYDEEETVDFAQQIVSDALNALDAEAQ